MILSANHPYILCCICYVLITTIKPSIQPLSALVKLLLYFKLHSLSLLDLFDMYILPFIQILFISHVNFLTLDSIWENTTPKELLV